LLGLFIVHNASGSMKEAKVHFHYKSGAVCLWY